MYLWGMKKAAQPDYKTLYEQALLSHKILQEKLDKSGELIDKKDHQILMLNFELDKFRKYLFGQKNEKMHLKNIDVSQMHLFDLSTSVQVQEELSMQVEVTEKKPAKKRAKGEGRMALPAELRREEIIIEPKEDTTGCVLIGEDVTEVLDVVPAELYVIKYIRRKYALHNGEGIIQGQLPERVINKGIPSNRLVGQMVMDKYVFAMPLHRQIDKYRRLGVSIPASTASDWMMKTWKHLVPLWELMKLLLLRQNYLQVDETPIKVQDRQHKKGIHQGYMWVHHAPVDKLVWFNYSKGRSKEVPHELLKGYQGIIQSDGYGVYESLYGGDDSPVVLVFCMAHARRKFVEAVNYDREKATHVLEKIQLLYKIEAELRESGASWEQRAKVREGFALPILKEIGEWLQEQALTVLPDSPLGKAITYTLTRWDGLSAYAKHGQLEIDNNLVENAIRPLAIGRKNFLFAGSHDAAEMTAAMYSFMATCKKNQVDEMEWLTDVLGRIQDHKQKDLYQLLPNNWKKYKAEIKA